MRRARRALGCALVKPERGSQLRLSTSVGTTQPSILAPGNDLSPHTVLRRHVPCSLAPPPLLFRPFCNGSSSSSSVPATSAEAGPNKTPLAALKAPAETADQVIEALEHRVLQLPGEAIALQYDPSGVVREHTKPLLQKCGARLLSKFFDAEAKSFHLDNMGLTDFDFLVVARLARFHAQGELEFLNLNNNAGGDLGADAIADHVVRHGRGKLRSLFLSNNGISDAGLRRLAREIQTSNSIKILELRKNAITDLGVEQSLAPMLRANKSLQAVFLNGCIIGDAGAVKLVTALPTDRKVQLWLGGNEGISERMKEVLSEMAGGEGVVKFK